MSPTSPLSATSMDISPISATRGSFLTNMPSTPVIAPSLHLPRLVTSVRGSLPGMDGIRRASPVFQLLTPSPLSLNRSPLSSGRYSAVIGYVDNHPTSPTFSLHACSSGRPPNDNTRLASEPVSPRRVPTLVRYNANEGFEKMQLEDVLSDHRPERGIHQRLRRAATDDEAHLEANAGTILTPRPRSRSPIAKQRYRRRPVLRQRNIPISTSNLAPELIIRPPVSPQTQARQHELRARVAHLARPLVPLVSVLTGEPHPTFPTSLLQYQLLTHEQLDSLARWYHQTGDAGDERWHYPCSMGPDKVWISTDQSTTVDLQTKRRRWGRFIGLRGCESPMEQEETFEELQARMEREWNEAMRRAREADKLREKLGRGWF